MQSPEDNVHNGEISPEEFDRLSLLLRPPTDRRLEESSPMDTSPSPFIGTHLCLYDNICASCSAALLRWSRNKWCELRSSIESSPKIPRAAIMVGWSVAPVALASTGGDMAACAAIKPFHCIKVGACDCRHWRRPAHTCTTIQGQHGLLICGPVCPRRVASRQHLRRAGACRCALKPAEADVGLSVDR